MQSLKLATKRRIRRALQIHGFTSELKRISLVQCSVHREGVLLARETIWRGLLYWSPAKPYLIVRELGQRFSGQPLISAYEGFYWANLPTGMRAQIGEGRVVRMMYAPFPLCIEVQEHAPIRIPSQDVRIDIRIIHRNVLIQQVGASVNVMGWIIAGIVMVMALLLVVFR